MAYSRPAFVFDEYPVLLYPYTPLHTTTLAVGVMIETVPVEDTVLPVGALVSVVVVEPEVMVVDV